MQYRVIDALSQADNGRKTPFTKFAPKQGFLQSVRGKCYAIRKNLHRPRGRRSRGRVAGCRALRGRDHVSRCHVSRCHVSGECRAIGKRRGGDRDWQHPVDVSTSGWALNLRSRHTALEQAEYLLERMDHARDEERRRIARDLHDRLGESLSSALRQIELHEITSGFSAEPAKESLVEAMRRLRVTLSDLRQEPVRSLQSALARYIDSVAPEPEVLLRTDGDEAWVPDGILDEAFLVIREAIRNVLRHSDSATMTIAVTIAPDELYARVQDDGRGFLPGRLDGSTSPENGLLSMRERACLMGGRLTVSSAPGQGTLVQLRVPLPGRPDD